MNEDVKLEFEPSTDAGKFDKKYVEETEEMLDLEFSPEFLAFLKHHNGGVPKKRHFKLGNNVKVVGQFLCLYPNYKENERFGQNDIGVVWSQIEDRLNEFLVPFAEIYPGDYLCFDYETGDDPSIVLWNHELSDEDSPVTDFVAKSFKQFLTMLTNEG